MAEGDLCHDGIEQARVFGQEGNKPSAECHFLCDIGIWICRAAEVRTSARQKLLKVFGLIVKHLKDDLTLSPLQLRMAACTMVPAKISDVVPIRCKNICAQNQVQKSF